MVKWIKIQTDIFDNRKIKQIDYMPESDAIIVIWFKLLCLCGKVNDNGMIYLTTEVPYTEEMLAKEFGKDISVIRLALKTFEMFGMLEVIDNIYCISNWEKYQNIEGMEKIREQNRIRKQNQRIRQREIKVIEIDSHVTSRDSHATDKDIDKELEEDKEKKTYKGIVSRYTQNEELISSLNDFVEMRKKTKGFTTRALELALNTLDKLAADDYTKIEIVNQSVMNSWKTFYQLKQDKKVIQQKSDNPFMDMLKDGDY